MRGTPKTADHPSAKLQLRGASEPLLLSGQLRGQHLHVRTLGRLRGQCSEKQLVVGWNGVGCLVRWGTEAGQGGTEPGEGEKGHWRRLL